MTFSYKRVGFDTGVSRFTNDGTFPFTLDRASARATIDLKGKTGLALEWNRGQVRRAEPVARQLRREPVRHLSPVGEVVPVSRECGAVTAVIVIW